MIRLFFILFSVFMLLSSTSSGQEETTRRFKGGILAGFNVAQVEGDMSAGYNKFGFQGGLRVAIVLKEKMDLGVEMLFSQRGSAQRNPNLGQPIFKLTLNYIEVPVLFNYMDWLSEDEDYYKLHFHGGFSYSRLFGFSTDDNMLTSLGDFFRNNDISWIAGATFYINPNIGFTARYSRSLYPFFQNSDMVGIPNANSLIAYQISFHTLYMF